MKKVAIVMGSKNDFPVVKPAVGVLKEFGVCCDVRVMSAHRSPQIAAEFADNARKAGYGVIIAAAGKAAHLAGVIAGHTSLPVIGLPVKSSLMDGLDSLLSTVQMPGGIPVATVAVDGALNAGLLAVQILATADDGLVAKLDAYKQKMIDKIVEDDKILQEEIK
ncbi:MAG TPA: 5-(carboxyamino)imidazole ribonucleotide mutase [Candidatus Stercoripulliclostridium merdipullorum]|uniref:N5-carboxyaminoimidazole ribonucleotide mutase n=1 Tax=Candidatus Stercoripulliclostridium merdipullorum TaxID=2840952 RepID=A0A9D1NBC3_9FIRM|nr:5-(carboxyamino)imidazole ribonucleotide mutase [Candidatus Stercoripulliclostridium merdipullorum]